MTEMISIKNCLNEFIPTLDNFCSKSPLQMTITLVQETGDITLFSQYDKSFNYKFKYDPSVDKKSQIKKIKTDIEKKYPIIFDHKRFPLAKDKQEELIKGGASIRDVLNMREDVYLPRYKVLRVHNKYNELDAFDFKTRKVVKFKITIPLVSFLSKLFIMQRVELSEFFREKTSFMYCIKNNVVKNA